MRWRVSAGGFGAAGTARGSPRADCIPARLIGLRRHAPLRCAGRTDASRRQAAPFGRALARRAARQDRRDRWSVDDRVGGGLVGSRLPPSSAGDPLAGWYPSSSITVVNRGVPRQTAQQMLERFPTDVIPEDPVLVIWETGTTDAVRGVGVDDFAAHCKPASTTQGARDRHHARRHAILSQHRDRH